MRIEFRHRAPPKGEGNSLSPRRVFGDEPHWSLLIPELHASLADDDVPLVLPAPPQHFDWVCSLHEMSLYLMQQLLGWTDPGAGLQWWYREGCPELDDPRLAVLSGLRARDPDFELFVAWCWRHGGRYNGPGSFLSLAAGLAPIPPWNGSPERRLELFHDSDWFQLVATRIAELELGHQYIENPLTGGTNSLHLGHSMAPPWTDELAGRIVHSQPADRHAVLMLDEARGWYRQLLLHGQKLPALGDHSWRVDVVVKPVGWLGTFRHSRDTGLWFQGRHSIHLAGQLDGLRAS